MSISKLTDDGYRVDFTMKRRMYDRENKLFATASKENKLYKMDEKFTTEKVMLSKFDDQPAFMQICEVKGHSSMNQSYRVCKSWRRCVKKKSI